MFGKREISGRTPKWSLAQTPSTAWSKARRQSATSSEGPVPHRTIT